MKKTFIPLPVRVPAWIKWVHPSWYIWDKKSKDKVLYLTFDDGPIPEVTEWVLDTLSRKRISATFFCIGDNVRKHPEIFKRILSEGHQVGNHTFNHLKGWLTDDETYLKNIHLSEVTMSQVTNSGAKSPNFPLFRPPYGKIKRGQATQLQKMGYDIIMYRTVAYDWEANVSPEKCLANVIENARKGDLIVFHDSIKAFANMKYALPRMLDYYLEKGYRFDTL